MLCRSSRTQRDAIGPRPFVISSPAHRTLLGPPVNRWPAVETPNYVVRTIIKRQEELPTDDSLQSKPLTPIASYYYHERLKVSSQPVLHTPKLADSPPIN